MSFFNDAPGGESDSHFTKFKNERVFDRLKDLLARAENADLAGLDPLEEPLVALGMQLGADGRPVKNCYGAFGLSWKAQQHPEWPAQIAAEAAGLREGFAAGHRGTLRFLIWAGMGGSAEDKSMFNAVGLLKRGPCCYVLDSTDPAKLKSIFEDIERRHALPMPAILRSTLVVGMAMGMSSVEPAINLERLEALYTKYHVETRDRFVYLALPGSLLDQFASKRGYRKLELQLDGGNTTIGRQSGPLTRGSLLPLALAKNDMQAWIEGAFLTMQQAHTAWRLAAFLHVQGLAGRDKVTLLLPKQWTGAGIWTKQDFEESLGKCEALGIKIVAGEKPKLANYRSPKDPQQDRCFLEVRVRGTAGFDARKVGLLRRAGYPVAVVTFPGAAQLSTYMQFMHHVVFGVAYLRGMNFVTQPAVELSKDIATSIYDDAQKTGGVRETKAWKTMAGSPRQAHCGEITLYHHHIPFENGGQPANAAQICAGILRRMAAERRIEYAELTFFGDTRYSQSAKAVRKVLERSAERVFGARLKMPADIYEGPAVNHSYHEMIIGHGKCFSTLLVSMRQQEFAAARANGDYHLAQYLGTIEALANRGRPVLAITLEDLGPDSLRTLDEFFRRVAALLRR